MVAFGGRGCTRVFACVSFFEDSRLFASQSRRISARVTLSSEKHDDSYLLVVLGAFLQLAINQCTTGVVVKYNVRSSIAAGGVQLCLRVWSSDGLPLYHRTTPLARCL